MKTLTLAAVSAALLFGPAVPATARIPPAVEAAYQRDADAKRINDVHRIAALLDEYKAAVGHYPYVDRPVSAYGKDAYMVTIGMPRAEADLKKRPNPFGMQIDTRYSRDLIAVLSEGLNRRIVLPVDPQRVPIAGPNAYFVFFFDDDTYLVTAYLYGSIPQAAPLAPHVNLYGVSSGSLGGFMSGLGLQPRRLADIPLTELEQATAAGARSDEIFARFTAIDTDGK